eukprot:749010-Alexandrium_andersonii.AAC.1
MCIRDRLRVRVRALTDDCHAGSESRVVGGQERGGKLCCLLEGGAVGPEEVVDSGEPLTPLAQG